MILSGELPTSPVVFAACDSVYFMRHAVAFAKSSSSAGFDTHIHVHSPTTEVKLLAKQLPITFSYDREQPREELRTWFACLRFYVLPYILLHARQVLVLDIDCFVMKPFDFPTTDIGYFPRPGRNDNEKVAAGAFYISSEAYDIATTISQQLSEIELKWYADQIVLHRVLSQVDPARATKFGMQFMDWEFSQGSCIWTGKGQRKYNSARYLKMQNKFNKL